MHFTRARAKCNDNEKKKFNGIKIFWQWKKSVSNVVISREIIYVFQNAFNYIKQIK